jgi:hypothetical protein
VFEVLKGYNKKLNQKTQQTFLLPRIFLMFWHYLINGRSVRRVEGLRL